MQESSVVGEGYGGASGAEERGEGAVVGAGGVAPSRPGPDRDGVVMRDGVGVVVEIALLLG